MKSFNSASEYLDYLRSNLEAGDKVIYDSVKCEVIHRYNASIDIINEFGEKCSCEISDVYPNNAKNIKEGDLCVITDTGRNKGVLSSNALYGKIVRVSDKTLNIDIYDDKFKKVSSGIILNTSINSNNPNADRYRFFPFNWESLKPEETHEKVNPLVFKKGACFSVTDDIIDQNGRLIKKGSTLILYSTSTYSKVCKFRCAEFNRRDSINISDNSGHFNKLKLLHKCFELYGSYHHKVHGVVKIIDYTVTSGNVVIKLENQSPLTIDYDFYKPLSENGMKEVHVIEKEVEVEKFVEVEKIVEKEVFARGSLVKRNDVNWIYGNVDNELGIPSNGIVIEYLSNCEEYFVKFPKTTLWVKKDSVISAEIDNVVEEQNENQELLSEITDDNGFITFNLYEAQSIN